jgi:hypothetical protein
LQTPAPGRTVTATRRPRLNDPGDRQIGPLDLPGATRREPSCLRSAVVLSPLLRALPPPGRGSTLWTAIAWASGSSVTESTQIRLDKISCLTPPFGHDRSDIDHSRPDSRSTSCGRLRASDGS